MNELNTAPARKNSDEIEIDLSKVLDAFKRFWALILVATLLCGAIGFVVSNFGMQKQYAASVKMIVNTSADAELVSNDQVNSAKNLVSTYGVIITGSNVLTKVIQRLGLSTTYEELSKRISLNAVTDTQVFKVTATAPSVEEAKSIIEEIVNVAPAEVEATVDAGSCKVVSGIDYDESPVAPSVKKYTAVAAFAGFLLSLAYALFRVLSKAYIVSDKDLQEQLQLPVLGVIPLLEET